MTTSAIGLFLCILLRISTFAVDAEEGSDEGKKWCIVKVTSNVEQLQKNIDFVCGSGVVDCKPITAGGMCFVPNDIFMHASFAMNSYYRIKGQNDSICDFSGTGTTVTLDPSIFDCRYI